VCGELLIFDTNQQFARHKREKVISWVKYLENGEGCRAHREGTPPYDFSWMWRELGVLEERR
jgi:hypothetical protein